MNITQRHIGIALLLALVFHGGIALWFTHLDEKAETKPPPANSLQQVVTVTLQATQPNPLIPATEAPIEQIVESTIEPVIKPMIEPVAKPKAKPKPERKLQPKTQPNSKPITKSVPKPTPQTKETPTPEPKMNAQPKIPPPMPKTMPKTMPETSPATPSQQLVQTKPRQVAPVALSDEEAKKYQQQLSAWLNKYKEYPKRAKRMRIEGEGVLQILIDRAGHAQKITLKQSTGNRLLDKAALKIAQQASPFPKMPKNDPRPSLEFEVPISFLLR